MNCPRRSGLQLDLKTSSSAKIVIVDYRTGNTNSIKKALDRTSSLAVISSQVEDVTQADKLILPGVGHFTKAMANLEEPGLLDALSHCKEFLDTAAGIVAVTAET